MQFAMKEMRNGSNDDHRTWLGSLMITALDMRWSWVRFRSRQG